MERFDLIIKRSEFLREARKIESWDNVVFVDETWLNANHTVSRSWTDETKASTSKTRKLITEDYERDIRVDTIIDNEIVIQVTDSDDSSGESGSESE